MTTLNDYNEFAGHHWETGTVRNHLAYRGVTAPHTGKPYSEAMLMGISGGAVIGYFVFDYQGIDPMARILVRNTFDPLDTILTRLGTVQNILHTAKPEKGVANLVDVLDSGVPAIVWADMFSLSYNSLDWGDDMWAMMPILVYGYDEASDTVMVADRSRHPLRITTDELQTARGRVKKDKFRVLTLDPPIPEKLPAAVQAGIWDCINLYTEKPPRGSKNNFGLAAFQHLAKMLTNTRNAKSWEKKFPAGRPMYAGLISIFRDTNEFGNEGCAERDLYADFLDEASGILNRPGLQDVAGIFRRSAAAWDQLGGILLPDSVAPFKEARELTLKRRDLFMENGDSQLDEIRAAQARLDALPKEMESDFPLDASEVTALREHIAEAILGIHDIEAQAVEALTDAMA
jgi:hypothetical protein